MKSLINISFLIISLNSTAQLYFPPSGTNNWDTISPASLGWCQDKLDTLIDYVEQNNTKAFIILKDGKIVVEKYFGTFTIDSLWYWASAGKSLMSFLIGLAQEQGYLTINDSLPKYLGHGFSTCSTSAEDSMRIIHQLNMTTGFDDMYGGSGSENHCTDDTCLVCIAAPGTRWAYHNAPYTMTHWVLDSATQMTTNAFKTNNLSSCGITGLFVPSGYNEVYFSKARSFARFGLLMLAKGIWGNDTIMHDTSYFSQMINTSQGLNLAYGYLWWLNGKTSYRIPNTQIQIPGYIVPNAPADMYAAFGKNDQILNVVPSMDLVIIRMGDPFDIPLEIATIANDSIWSRLNDVMCNTTTTYDLISENDIHVYPNPVNQNFIVSFPKNRFDLVIHDITGRRIAKYQNCIDVIRIDFEEMQNGIYYLQIITENSQVVNKVITKY